jgi:hypothetical protein
MAKSPEKHITRTALGTLAVVVGLLCLVGAVVFGLVQTIRLSNRGRRGRTRRCTGPGGMIRFWDFVAT